jgi:hypothetical protein
VEWDPVVTIEAAHVTAAYAEALNRAELH